MLHTDTRYDRYIKILKEELIPAMGCTEPIALAYGAAKARALLGTLPDRLLVQVSGNIIKNVKSVVVPHTGGLRGIPAAVAAGAALGDASRKLEVLSDVEEERISEITEYLKRVQIEVVHADTPHIFDIMITAFCGEESAFVRILEHHTNIVCMKKNGQTVFEKKMDENAGKEENRKEETRKEEDRKGADRKEENRTEEARKEELTDRSCLSVEGIVDFADSVETEEVREILERQISYNMAIAEEGLAHDYGANIGKTLLFGHEEDLERKMRAYAAAGSDARMNGCELPVIINSGSGNQGITSSVPVIVYAGEKGIGREELLRALCVSNLITIHLKTGIGRLSAYCGVVSAGCGAAAGIAYLQGGRFDMIAHTVVNALAMDSGIVCDGAKASCAAKISSAVDAGMLGLAMYQNGNQFWGGDGLVRKGVENTISNIGRLARNGMQETDKEIIRLMMEDC